MVEPASKKPKLTSEEPVESEEDDLEDEEEEDEEEDDDDDSDDDFGDPHADLTFGDDDSSAAVIWMHGLGDSPAGWASQAYKMREQVPHTKWILPCAPENPVTCNRGVPCTSWMDLTQIPITTSTKDNGKDLPESIVMIHKLIDDLVADGMPANRIVLGGFSQGAALALGASLKYPKRIAGVCVLSGWPPKSLDIPSLLKSSANKGTPIIVCHGDADTTVFQSCGKLVAKMLKDGGGCVEFHGYANMAHGSSKEEIEHVVSFLKRVVP
mmetsp:Transcript_8379/g.14165  ORF Transcript_8379/g.14165 Transcript_8379/m.14165 type:complete len:268 (-) Transcript_8379:76-879(-)